jgi:predicted aspartyl protease
LRHFLLFARRWGPALLALLPALSTGCGALARYGERDALLRATGGIEPMQDVGPRGVVEVPMVRSANHMIPIVQARLNRGHPFPLVIDTGGNHTMISRRRAEASQLLPMAGHGHITTAFGNQERTEPAMAGELSMGRLHLRGVPVLVHEFRSSELSSALGSDLNVLGTPALAAFSYVTFDYARGVVAFSYGEPFSPPPAGAALRLRLAVESEGHLSVPVTFPGGRTMRALVDTGYDGVLLMSPHTLHRLDLTSFARHGREVRAIGPGAQLHGRVFTIPNIELDGQPIPNAEAWTGDIGEPLLLGSGLLRYFRTTFDFRRMVLWLEPPVH